jgi:hypothetical protein
MQHRSDGGMNPDLLLDVGQALFPTDWTLNLSRELHVNQRRLRRMAAGSESIPPGIITDLLVIIRRRREELAALQNKLLEIV